MQSIAILVTNQQSADAIPATQRGGCDTPIMSTGPALAPTKRAFRTQVLKFNFSNWQKNNKITMFT